jgi:leucyl aminopeptidase
MQVRFTVPELQQIDALRCEALALPFFSDERPLRGALGLIDWRMCGFVSRLRMQERVRGDALETVLLPARPKLTMDKLFLFGLGPQDEFDTKHMRRAVEHMLNTLSRARVRTTALALPGRATARITPEKAIEAFLAVSANNDDHDELILLEPLEAQRAMEPVIERERRRARAHLP